MKEKEARIIDEGSNEKAFIHKAIRHIAKKQGMKMPFLERRLLLVGMMKDPRVNRDLREFVDMYFGIAAGKEGENPEAVSSAETHAGGEIVSAYNFFRAIAKDVKF